MTMKKISLLLLFSLTVFFVSALPLRKIAEHQPNKISQNVLSDLIPDENIMNLSVYPNPVVDLLKISFNSCCDSKAIVSLFNNIGKQVFKQESIIEQGSNLIMVDFRTKSIEPGIYFLQIVVRKEVLTRKLIVK